MGNSAVVANGKYRLPIHRSFEEIRIALIVPAVRLHALVYTIYMRIDYRVCPVYAQHETDYSGYRKDRPTGVS